MYYSNSGCSKVLGGNARCVAPESFTSGFVLYYCMLWEALGLESHTVKCLASHSLAQACSCFTRAIYDVYICA